MSSIGVSLNKSVCSFHPTKISINQKGYDFLLHTNPFMYLGTRLGYSSASKILIDGDQIFFLKGE